MRLCCDVKLIFFFFFFHFFALQVPVPFSTFLDLCKKRMHRQTNQQQQHLNDDHCVASQTDHTQPDYLSLEDVPEQIYLAQV